MSQSPRTPNGTATLLNREEAPGLDNEPNDPSAPPIAARVYSPELIGSLAEVKGQAQFLLYLADQIEDSLQQLSHETDAGHGTFLCKVLAMYSSQLESKHQGLGDRIAETCQEVYVTVREFDVV